jgi:hypothetical protein
VGRGGGNWQGGGNWRHAKPHFRPRPVVPYGFAAPFFYGYASPYYYDYGDDPCWDFRFIRGAYRRVWVCY